MSNTQQDNKQEILALIKNFIIPVLEFENKSGNTENSTPNEQQFSYVQQRAMINQIFETTRNNYNIQSIMLRLIVIDSLYSTNAAYSYFSFEEMAKAIKKLGKEEEAAEYFYGLVKDKKDDTQKLFSEKYGIRKNLKDGSKQMSLMSKYAYYVLLQSPSDYPLGFPIYDSLAIKMYPKVCKNVGINEPQKITESTSIKKYIELLNTLREKIFSNTDLFNKYQQYDLLDAYLWRMGKLDEGNYSLLFNKDDYKKFITNIGLCQIKDEDLYQFGTNGLNLVKKIQNNKKQDIYKYDFNKLVRYQCLNIEEVANILIDVTNKDNMATMITHWKKLYANLK